MERYKTQILENDKWKENFMEGRKCKLWKKDKWK